MGAVFMATSDTSENESLMVSEEDQLYAHHGILNKLFDVIACIYTIPFAFIACQCPAPVAKLYGLLNMFVTVMTVIKKEKCNERVGITLLGFGVAGIILSLSYNVIDTLSYRLSFIVAGFYELWLAMCIIDDY